MVPPLQFEIRGSLLSSGRIWSVLGLVLTAVGVLFASGWGALALGLGLVAGVMAVRGAQSAIDRRVAWGVVITAGTVLLMVFTVLLAAPNVVIAGQKATERMAVATLRTFLWAQDQMIEIHGRAGVIGELSVAHGVGGGDPLPAPLLRPPFKALIDGPQGKVVAFSGYNYAIYVRDAEGVTTDGGRVPAKGAVSWIAYAWPTDRGRSGFEVFCINGAEDILESSNNAERQRYTGTQHVPNWDACVVGDGHRLVEGQGGDGGKWTVWRGKRTRRARVED